MIHAADDALARAVDAPFDAPLVLVTGAVGSGKSDALAQRYASLLARDGCAPDATIVASPGADGARDLAARIARLLPTDERAAFAAAPFAGVTLDVVAFAIVAEGAVAGGLAPDLERLEPYEAEEIFERAAAPLFSADWADYLGADIDPEISGLRTPDRFAAAVLRLIAKLRDAGIGPETMLAQALRGATTFYAQPPNFAEPGLLFATKDEHRSSLMVPPAELHRQHRREIDLAKIVAKLYRSYLDELVRHGCLGAGDAIAEATRLLAEQPQLAARWRERLRFAVVDDVHDLRSGDVRFLQAIFGAALARVTFAGTLASAVQTFAGARPEATFKLAATTIALPGNGPVPPAVVAVAQTILAAAPRSDAIGDVVRVVHLAGRDEELAFVAAEVARHIAAGTPPARIAVVHRSARPLAPYEAALVAENVPVSLHGDIDVLARADVGDALAVLWAAADPFHHAWLLRALQLPATGLSDATLALLCGEPAHPQAMLFALPPEEVESDRRWDRRRDLRLATNILRGERDGDLPADARERVAGFRTRRAAWAIHARDAGVGSARAIVADAGLLEKRPGEAVARHARRVALIGALFVLLDRYAARFPGAPLDDALAMLERIAPAERGPVVALGDDGVFVGAIDRIGPRRFDHVFVVDVRAGSFPPYYVPDAFLFSPRWGMIPKDAAGDAVASRTAKFTWYSHQAKLRETFAAEHRRLLALAISRADVTATISAGGRLTRGVAAPEFVAELLGSR